MGHVFYIEVTAEGAKLRTIRQVLLHTRQAKEVDHMAPALEIFQEVIKTQFIPIVGWIRDKRGQD